MKNSRLLRCVLGLSAPLFLLGAMAPGTQTPGNPKPGQLSLQIFENPHPAEGCVGDQVQLEVLAYPKAATYVWRKDGTPLVPAQTGPTLMLGPLAATDSGSYDVVVSLGHQKKTSAPAMVAVHEGPTITAEPGPTNQTVGIGASVSYSVTATGSGTLTYQWRKKPLVPFSSFADIPGATAAELDLGTVNTGDSGTYRCIVTDECGATASVRCKLIIVR